MDFANITACGGDCTGCEHYKSGECVGCNSNGGICVKLWSSECSLCKCCREHNVRFCGVCDDFPCGLLKITLTWDKDGIENLKRLGEIYLKEKNNV